MRRQDRTLLPGLHSLKGVGLAVGGLLMVVLVACGGSEDNIVGVWQPDDGSSPKAINGDGSCSGMYYYDGEPLDIGGPMTCSFSHETDSTGSHTLLVQQPPNHESLQAKFADADTVEVYLAGQLLFTMLRQ